MTDPTELELQRIVREAGYEVGSGAEPIGAVDALEAAYQRDPDALAGELQVRREDHEPDD